MEVVRLPRDLRRHLLALFLLLPFPFVEGLMLSLAKTGRLFFNGEWLLWPVIFTLPLVWIFKRSARTGRAMAVLFAVLGFAWSLWSYQRAAAQGDIVLSLLAWLKFAAIMFWSYRAWRLWGASFLSAEKKWYEGAPQSIPNLLCQLKKGANPAKVNRIDRQGLVVFGLPEAAGQIGTELELELELSHQASAKRFICSAEVVSHQKKPLVIGLRFKGLTSDQKKDLGDFVEKLKGEGYVDLGHD